MHTRLDSNAEIITCDYTEALSECRRLNKCFDLVLLDPPYCKGFEKDALALISRFGLAAPHCMAVCEHSASDSLPAEIGNFIHIKTKTYGTVSVSVYESKE